MSRKGEGDKEPAANQKAWVVDHLNNVTALMGDNKMCCVQDGGGSGCISVCLPLLPPCRLGLSHVPLPPMPPLQLATLYATLPLPSMHCHPLYAATTTLYGTCDTTGPCAPSVPCTAPGHTTCLILFYFIFLYHFIDLWAEPMMVVTYIVSVYY